MAFCSRFAMILLTGATAAVGGTVMASERYRCDTEAIRDCSPSGCKDIAVSGSLSLDLPAGTYRLCEGGDCRDGGVETWSGKMKAEDKGYVGFSQTGTISGFTGSADLDSGEFVLIDGSHYWSGRCKAE